MKGGSVASDAVMSLVSQDTYAQMNARASNQIGGCSKCNSSFKNAKKTMGAGSSSGSSSLMNSAKKMMGAGSCTRTSSGGSSLMNSAKKMMGAGSCTRTSSGGSSLMNSAKKMMGAGSSIKSSSSAKKTMAGSGCSSCGKKMMMAGSGCSSCSSSKKKESMLSSIFDLSGGNEFKSLYELTTPEETNYSLRHQKGGADPLALDYSGIKSSGLAPGPGFNAAAAQYSNKFLASDPINIMPTISKTVTPDFGSTTEGSQPFTYATNDFQKAGASKKKKNTAKNNKKTNKKNTAQTNNKNKRQQNKF